MRIVIAEERPIFRDGLRRLLESEPGFHVVGEAEHRERIAAMVRELEPDILLIGASQHIVETLLEVNALRTPLRTILLTSRVDTPEVTGAIQHGVRGVVPTDSSAAALFESLYSVMAGRFWNGYEGVTNASEGLRTLYESRRRTKTFGLTSRELDIVRAVVDGRKNREIARGYSISENTVKRHISHIFTKIGASSRVEIALFASYHRLLDVV